MQRTVRGLLAAAMIAAAAAAHAGEWRDTVGAWSVFAERSAEGTPVCYAASDRGPGERLIFARSDDRLFLILKREAWRLSGELATVRFAIDGAAAVAQPAQVDARALILDWAPDDAIVAALRRGRWLELAAPGAGRVRVALEGSGAAIDAVDACVAAEAAAHAAETAHWRDPLRHPPARDEAVDRPALARDLTVWLRRAAPEHAPEVIAANDALRLTTAFADGRVVVLEGTTHAAVLVDGAKHLVDGCPTGGRVAERDRHDVNGYLLARTALACATPREAVILSYRSDAGGLLIVVDAVGGDDRARDLTAAIVEEIAEREGLVLELRGRGLSS